MDSSDQVKNSSNAHHPIDLFELVDRSHKRMPIIMVFLMCESTMIGYLDLTSVKQGYTYGV